MIKRNVNVMSAALLFGAALSVIACGDDSNSSPPAEGEGEGVEGEGEGEGEGVEGEGEGEGEECVGKTDCPVVTNCDRCLASCEGSHTCETFCYPDPCEPEPEYDPLTDPLLADYRWFNGEWDCLEGWDCYAQAVRVITVQSWDPELGAVVHGFFRGGAILYFKKNPDTGNFETNTPDTYGVARGEVDVNTRQLVLDLIEDFGEGVQTARGIFRKR